MSQIPTVPQPASSIPAFETIDSHAALLAWSESYCRRVVAVTDLAVDVERVDWDVSTRAKRRAAAVIHPRLDSTALGDPVDWERRPNGGQSGATVGEAGGDTCSGDTDHSGPPDCTIRLTWKAAQSYDRETWAETLRHELVHVEQFQRFGTTGHGPRFERRADALETTVNCERFATPKYVLTCPDCETVVARRFRDCKLVRRHEEYRSTCCTAPLALTRTGLAD